MKRTVYTALGLMMASFTTFAQTETKADSAAPAPATEGKMAMSGYMDSYYFHNFNQPVNGTNLGASGFERAFEKNANEFNLGLIQTKFVYTANKSEAVIDLTFGPNADWGNYGNVPFLGSPFGASAAGVSVFGATNIKQAYFTWKATSKLSLTAGQFGTHIGYEVIDAPVNYNYSLSNLFNNGPFYHTGLKGTYSLSDKSSLMIGLVNNWDAIYDNNKFKTTIAQFYISPADGWNVYVNYIGGIEDVFSSITSVGTKDTRSAKRLFDLTTGYQISDKFYVGLNAAYGFKTKFQDPDDATKFNKSKGWGGAALYSNYAISTMFGIGVRAEYFDNTNGVQYILDSRGNGTDVTSLTLTPNFTLADGHLIFKPEFRYDIYKKLTADTGAGEDEKAIQQFQDKDGMMSKNSLPTLGLSAIYKF